MKPFWETSTKEEPGDYYPEEVVVTKESKERISPVKAIAIGAGALFAISHIGLLGYLVRKPEPPNVPQVPTINIPRGDYSSYKIQAGRDGYTIEYKANDPAILESQKSLDLNQEKKGLFGGGTEIRREYRRDQYTMDGTRNIGGAIDAEGKSAKDVECIVADAGARSQGAMAGTAIASGVAAPALASIPYVGWLAGGWALLLGKQVGETVGSTVGGVFNDC
tara:strand:- start:1338 stop:2000 length:663 start_codon:yes stop_codon:yes gene_type:complete